MIEFKEEETLNAKIESLKNLTRILSIIRLSGLSKSINPILLMRLVMLS